MYGLNNYVVSTSTCALTATDIYKRFIAERNCILENKWFMSEREGRDVGFERALLDCFINHITQFFLKLKNFIF